MEKPDRTFYLSLLMQIVAEAKQTAEELDAIDLSKPKIRKSTIQRASKLLHFMAESQQSLFQEDAENGVFDRLMDQFDSEN